MEVLTAVDIELDKLYQAPEAVEVGANSSAPRPKRSSRCRASRRARASTCATSATTWRRWRARYRQFEDLTAMTTTYFNANANRLNALATRLGVLATLFLIWTLVTSFFGQNFRWLTDHVESLRGFLMFGVGGLLIPTAAAFAHFWSRRDEWL